MPQPPEPTPDVVCEHGTALNVHCCGCHSGFIFDLHHQCPEPGQPEEDWEVDD